MNEFYKNHELLTHKNIPGSLETTDSNDCWLDGEWTEMDG